MQNLSIFDINISSKLTGIFEQLQSTLRKFDFSDIKEKELYSKVQSINPKQDIVLEDIEWLYEDYEKLSDVFDGLDSDFSFLDSELANYLKKIIYSRNIAKREKIVILISHIEKLIEECCEFPYKSRVMGTSEPLKPLKAPYMARNPVKWGFFRLKGQEIPLKI